MHVDLAHHDRATGRRGARSILLTRGRMLGVAVLLAGACMSPVVAADVQWLTPVGGAFENPALWSSGVPGASDAAVFGASSSASPFTVSVSESRSLAGVRVLNQSPTLVGVGGPKFAPTITLASEWIVGGVGAAPSLTLRDITVALDNAQATVGVAGATGTLVIDSGAVARAQRMLVGVSGGIGNVLVREGGRLEAPTAAPSWNFGAFGAGTLHVESGGEVDLHGTPLVIGLSPGTGVATIDEGATLDLGGGTLTVGNANSSTVQGSGSLFLRGSLVNGGSIAVGVNAVGLMTIEPSASVSLPIVVGVGGQGSLAVSGEHAFPTLLAGASGSGSILMSGNGTAVTTGLLTVGSGGSGSVTVTGGASLAIDSLSLGGTSPVTALLAASGGSSITVDTIASFGSWLLNAPAQCRAADPGSIITLPAMQLAGSLNGSIVATNGGRIDTSSIGAQGNSSLGVEATNGGFIHCTGGISLEKGSLSVGVNGSVAATTVQTSPTVTTITLPLDRGPAITADSVSVNGPLSIAVAPGWTPAGPGDVPVFATASLHLPSRPTLPTLLGYPPLLIADAQGAFLRIIDHVDALTVPASITLAIGESTVVPATITVDGATYDISGQLTWEFDTPFVMTLTSQSSGQSVVKAVGPGHAVTTVHYGAASATIDLWVPGGGPLLFTLASGIGATYGNNDSGANDWEDLFNIFDSIRPQSIAADGSYAVFASKATNLGAVQSVPAAFGIAEGAAGPELLSGANGGYPASSAYDGGRLSPNGRYLVFAGNSGALFVIDRTTGVRVPVGMAPDGVTIINGGEPRISDDGRYVLFVSSMTTLVPDDTNGTWDVFLRDRIAGTTTRVSLSTQGAQLAVSSWPLDLSADGRHAFFVRASAGWQAAYAFDRDTGTVELAVPGSGGRAPHANILDAQVSGDGRFLSFRAQGQELFVPGAVPIGAQVYRRDRESGVITAISTTSDGAWPTAPIEGFAATADARFYAFTTRAANLTDDAVANGVRKLYRRDTLTGSNRLLSTGDLGDFNDDVDPSVAIGGGGTRVLFSTKASNVTPLDAAGHHDVFIAHVPLGPPADLDGDGLVGAGDLAILLGGWGTPGPGDLDASGSVGPEDLASLLGAWTS